MQPAITIENISKRYRLGLTHAGSIRELVNGTVARLIGRHRPKPIAPELDPTRVTQDGQFWALRDINLQIQPGEVVGIIGRNGAGKSTLLKILSRVTTPTEGRIEMFGRVASLLEVGTGFHPELTGRENVYMNGTILGMTRREIGAQFDAIVDFAGVEKFVDTPVKRYSSGMTVRLGFAVAAHLEPEILIVDEVLAVGDAQFQKRCMGKLNDVAKSGRTVLFVSHNMPAVRQLTTRTAVLADGQLAFWGATDDALQYYLEDSANQLADSTDLRSVKRVSWCGDRSVEFVDARFHKDQQFVATEPIRFQVSLDAHRPATGMWIGVTIYSRDGNAVGSAFSSELSNFNSGTSRTIDVNLTNPGLAPGRYWMSLGLMNARSQVTDVVTEVLQFDVLDDTMIPGKFSNWNHQWGRFRTGIEVRELPSQTK